MSAKKKDYTLTKDNESTIAENAFVRTWKLTLATRQAEWAKNYGTAKKS